MLMRCPRQYEFRYVRGFKEPPAVALTEGQCHHRALQFLNDGFIAKRKWPKLKDVVSTFHDHWSKGKKEIEDWRGENARQVESRADVMLDHYYTQVRATTNPEEAEVYFSASIAGANVVGYIDLLEGQHVVDYKVAARVLSARDLENHAQLGLYCALTGRAKGVIITLCKKNQGVFVSTGAFRPSVWALWWKEQVARVQALRKAGSFPMCDPTSWVCSSDYCGFWNRCRGAKPDAKRITVTFGGKPIHDKRGD